MLLAQDCNAYAMAAMEYGKAMVQASIKLASAVNVSINFPFTLERALLRCRWEVILTVARRFFRSVKRYCTDIVQALRLFTCMQRLLACPEAFLPWKYPCLRSIKMGQLAYGCIHAGLEFLA